MQINLWNKGYIRICMHHFQWMYKYRMTPRYIAPNKNGNVGYDLPRMDNIYIGPFYVVIQWCTGIIRPF